MFLSHSDFLSERKFIVWSCTSNYNRESGQGVAPRKGFTRMPAGHTRLDR